MHVRAFVTLAACLTLPVLAACQEPGELRMPSLAELQDHARVSVDVTFGPSALRMASSFMDDDDPQALQLKKTLWQLKSVRIRSYELTGDVALPRAKLDELRSQLAGPGWSQVVQVDDRSRNEDVSVYLAQDEHAVRGLAVISRSPHELTILNVVGRIDPRQVSALRNMFLHSDD